MIFTNRSRAAAATNRRIMPIQYHGSSTSTPIDTFSHKYRSFVERGGEEATPLPEQSPSTAAAAAAAIAPPRLRTTTASLRALTSDTSVPGAATADGKPVVKKMRWGEPTWFMFHTLAEKIKESEFPVLRLQLFDLVESICTNLPCPICSTHAKAYLAGTNFANITTKEHFRIFFLKFHNEVNRRKGYALFPYEQLAEKYGKANTVPIIHNFMAHFEDRNPSNVRMIADSLYRQRLVSVLKAWFSKNIQSFDL